MPVSLSHATPVVIRHEGSHLPTAPIAPVPSAAGARGPRGGHGANAEGGAAVEASPFANVLAGITREASSREQQVQGALHAIHGGRSLDASELLALQAGVYRYSEVIDLATKLVDRANNGVKTVIQGQ